MGDSRLGVSDRGNGAIPVRPPADQRHSCLTKPLDLPGGGGVFSDG